MEFKFYRLLLDQSAAIIFEQKFRLSFHEIRGLFEFEPPHTTQVYDILDMTSYET